MKPTTESNLQRRHSLPKREVCANPSASPIAVRKCPRSFGGMGFLLIARRFERAYRKTPAVPPGSFFYATAACEQTKKASAVRLGL
jgi:hypothetical protein